MDVNPSESLFFSLRKYIYTIVGLFFTFLEVKEST